MILRTQIIPLPSPRNKGILLQYCGVSPFVGLPPGGMCLMSGACQESGKTCYQTLIYVSGLRHWCVRLAWNRGTACLHSGAENWSG